MSYILSALKKVERKRQASDLPDLLAVQIEEPPPGERGRSRSLPVFTAVLVTGVVAAAAVGWLSSSWFTQPPPPQAFSSSPAPTTQQNRAAPLPAAAPAASDAPADTTVLSDFFSRPASSAPEAAGTAGFLDTAARLSTSLDGTPEFNELPPSMREHLPRFSISGHLYSDTRPQANKVIINGTALRAGQYVNDDLVVEEIVSDGVILDFRGLRFRVDKDQIFQ